MDVREAIDRAPMSRFQVVVVALCFVMNIIEGFDILVMAFAASGVAREWTLNASQIGLLLSSGLLGMAVGAAALTPLADRLGRRPLTLIGLVVASAGMLLSTLVTGYVQLGLCRLLTGLGVGAVIANLPVIVSEYSNRRSRGLSIAFFAVGLPLGGVVGGATAALVTAEFGWRATFLFGGALSAVTVAVMARLLPESLDYLTHRRPADALSRVNVLLGRMRLAPLTSLPPVSTTNRAGAVATILRGRAGLRTILLWVAFFSLLAGLYFANGWTPRLLEQSGLSAHQGITSGILLNLGGVAGTVLIMVLALYRSSYFLAAITFAGAGAFFVMMALSLGSLPATLAAAVLIGLTTNATGASVYAIAPALYPADVRATAAGWANAVGRLGGIIAPIIAGLLVDLGWNARGLFLLFAIPLFVSGAAIAALYKVLPARIDEAAAPVRAEPEAAS